MLNSTVLEVGIGLAFIYLFFSLIASTINEWVARWFDWRAGVLKKGITELLGSGGLAAGFHKHPLISGLRCGKSYPSYIPPAIFAMAVQDLGLTFTAAAGVAGAFVVRPSVGPTGPPLTIIEQEILSALVNGSTTVALGQLAIQQWFDDASKRFSGVYKRRVQIVIAVVALAIAVLFNIDTLALARDLGNNGTLRQTLVARATAAAATKSVADAQKELQGVTLPITFGWKGRDFDFASLPGILLSALAISLGAPFWFDTLNKLVNLRQAGAPPELQAQ